MFYEPRPPVHWSQALVTGTERRTEDSKTEEKTENLSAPREASLSPTKQAPHGPESLMRLPFSDPRELLLTIPESCSGPLTMRAIASGSR